MTREFWAIVALLVPIGVMGQAGAQFYPQRPYGPNVVMVPPVYPASDASSGGYDMPLPSPQASQQRLLEMLETGGVARPNHGSGTPEGCVYSGQVHSEGVVVRTEAGQQVCGFRAGAEPDASGQMPLSWRAAPGE